MRKRSPPTSRRATSAFVLTIVMAKAEVCRASIRSGAGSEGGEGVHKNFVAGACDAGHVAEIGQAEPRPEEGAPRMPRGPISVNLTTDDERPASLRTFHPASLAGVPCSSVLGGTR